MTELNNMMVVQSNDLIRQTNWKMNTVPLKLFKAAVANIDTYNPPKDNTVHMNKKELVRLLGSGSNYDDIKENLRQLITSVRVRNDQEKEVFVPLVVEVTWMRNSEDVSVTFHKELMPYIINLKERFLQYPAAALPFFKTKSGLILYENLLSRYNQYHNDTYIMTVAEIRRLTGTEKKYSAFKDFEKRIIKAGIDDMNQAGVEILAKYRKIRSGHFISEIEFTVRKRTSYKEKKYEEVINPSVLIENKEIPDEAADPERCPELEADQISFNFDEEPGQFYNF